MGYAKERELIKSVYPTRIAGRFKNQWHEKVDKMSDHQVVAVYMRFKAQGKLK